MSQFNVDDKIVKKPQDEVSLTPEQADEWLKCAEDKNYFFENYCYVQGQSGRMLFKPRDYQSRIIDTCENNRMVVVLSGRQSGKCVNANSTVLTSVTICDTVIKGEFSIEFIHRLSGMSDKNEALSEVFEYIDHRGKEHYEIHTVN